MNRRRRDFLARCILLLLIALFTALAGIAINIATSASPSPTWLSPISHNPWMSIFFLTAVLGLLAVAQWHLDGAKSNSGDSFNAATSGQLGETSPYAERVKAMLRLEVRRIWIDQVFARSLVSYEYIIPCVEEHPSKVESPWENLTQSDARPKALGAEQPLSIADLVRRYAGQILLLGGAGVGKTTMLLDLTKELLEASEFGHDPPVPVVFHLSSWTPDAEILTWLKRELSTRYEVSRRTARKAVECGLILPLLDGLDEVPDEDRSECVVALNKYRADFPEAPLIVTCRTEEYDRLPHRLRLKGAISIRPFDATRIDAFLKVSPSLAAALESTDIGTEARELLRTPLWLKILVLAVMDDSAMSIDDLLESLKSGKLNDSLLAEYVNTMLARPRKPLLEDAAKGPPSGALVHGLSVLAKLMTETGQTMLYPDDLKASWIRSGTSRRIVTGGFSWLFCLLVGCVALFGTWGQGILQSCFLVGMSAIVALSLADSVAERPTIRVKWQRPGPGTFIGLLYAASMPIGGLLYTAWFDRPPLSVFVVLGIITALGFAIVGSLHFERDGGVLDPGERIDRSFVSSAFAWITTGLVGGLVSGLLAGALRVSSDGVEAASSLSLWVLLSCWAYFSAVSGLLYVPVASCYFYLRRGGQQSKRPLHAVLWLFGIATGLALDRGTLSVGRVLHWALGDVLQVSVFVVLIFLSFRLAAYRPLLSSWIASTLAAMAILSVIRWGAWLLWADAIARTFVAGVLISALLLWLSAGGGWFISYVAVRRVLTRERTLPEPLYALLKEADNRILMQRVGSGYQFTHVSLQTYFCSGNYYQGRRS